MRHKKQRLLNFSSSSSSSLLLFVGDSGIQTTTTTTTKRALLLYATTFILYCSTCCTSVEALAIYMGLLKVGSPKSWDSSKKDLSYIRQAGVRQFISTYHRVQDFKNDELLWGDEIEYGIFKLDAASRKVRLSLRAREVMNTLNEKEGQSREGGRSQEGCHWVPEYGAWMVEATPDRPYTGYTTDLLRVERNMRLRRKRLLTVLEEDEVAPTISAPFRLGAQGEDGSVPATPVGGPRTCSDYIGDGIINPHPRFGTLTANIRQRRGDKVNIRVPLFRDLHTPEYQTTTTTFNNSAILPLLPPLTNVDGTDGCCGGDSQQLWRYGKDDACRELHGNDYVRVGCSKSSSDEQYGDQDVQDGVVLQKWLVDVKCAGCRGLFYRRAPNEIVPDADWPRNGNVVVGHELQTIPGWIRLQNGYYLPMHSDDGKIAFLHKISARSNNNNAPNNGHAIAASASHTAATTSNVVQPIGSDTPLFRGASTATGAMSAAAAAVVMDTKEAAVASLLHPDASATTTTTAAAVSQQQPHKEEQAREDSLRAAIHMDAMAFGMGCCCLQITFQAKDVDESRFIYDQLAVMAPIMMALTAATPILKGRLADTDARWGVISESVDDRTPAERGRVDPNAPYPEYNALGKRRIYKSRYDSISTYIYQGAMVDEQRQPNKTPPGRGKGNDRVLNMYNDVPVPVDEDSYQLLRANGIDPALAQHVAALFVRDPLVVFEDAVEEVDDETQTEHWESIQSTNWQTVRWKPPPPRNSPNDPHIGWRTEFRSMELQLTDFENAAFTAFVVLLTRVILTFDLNLYIPMSRVDANMQRAHSRNSAAKGKFFFRRHMAPLEEGDDGYGVKYVSMFSRATANGAASPSTSSPNDGSSGNTSPSTVEGAQKKADDRVSTNRRTAPCALGSDEENAYEEMTMGEIMCGKGEYFPGLIPLIFAYLDHINCDKITLERLTMYLDFIERRAKGELVTPATWMRSYVRNHPAYKQDSVVSDEIAYDLTVACTQIGEGRLHIPELLGDVKIKLVTTEGAYDTKLESIRAQNDVVLELLRRYTSRKAFCSDSSKQ